MNLVAIGLARGTLVHLVEEGSPTTLCGRRHGVNTRYVQVRFARPGLGVLPAADADCPRCAKIVAQAD